MELQNIQEQLNTEFAKSVTRIIFWFDDKGEYEDEVAELQLDNASLLVLDGLNWLYTKWLLQEKDTKLTWLIYKKWLERLEKILYLKLTGELPIQI